jgi:hypothetical protein
MRRCIYFLFILFISPACNQHERAGEKQLVPLLKQLSDLATVEYVITKIIKANDDKTWYKVGDRKILMSCKASLIAGIDLSKITEDDISIRKKEITMLLPRANLLSINIKPEDIKIEYQDISPFRSPFTNAERDALAAQGEAQIKNSADSLGILQAAEVNASLTISNFLKKLGYETINIRYDSEKSKWLK